MLDLAAANSIRDSFISDFDTVELMLHDSVDQIHDFMRHFLGLTGSTTDEAASKLSAMIKSARTFVNGHIYADAPSRPSPVIPKTIHKIWLTSENASVEPRVEYIDQILAEAAEYREFGWSHFLWIQKSARLSRTIERINGSAIKIMLIGDHLPAGPWEEIFSAFITDRKYAFAADILRMKILFQYGGIYADLGAHFTCREAAEFITDHFDYAAIFWHTMFFQNSLLAMPPRSRLGEIFMRIAETPTVIPIELLQPLTGIREGMAFSGLMITAILLSIYNDHSRICPLAPNAHLVSWSSEKSWYTRTDNDSGKYGNAYVPATGPSFLQAKPTSQTSWHELLGNR